MGLRELIFSNESKLWSISDHRVEKATIQTDTKTVLKGHPHTPFTSTEPVFGTGYQCIDCEKSFEDRESFKNEECYEVINNGS